MPRALCPAPGAAAPASGRPHWGAGSAPPRCPLGVPEALASPVQSIVLCVHFPSFSCLRHSSSSIETQCSLPAPGHDPNSMPVPRPSLLTAFWKPRGGGAIYKDGTPSSEISPQRAQADLADTDLMVRRFEDVHILNWPQL